MSRSLILKTHAFLCKFDTPHHKKFSVVESQYINCLIYTGLPLRWHSDGDKRPYDLIEKYIIYAIRPSEVDRMTTYK